MSNKTVSHQIIELRDRIKKLFYHRKNIFFLENHFEFMSHLYSDYFLLINRCVAFGFLQFRESNFLSYKVGKYFRETNFLGSGYRADFLKSENVNHTEIFSLKKEIQLTLFDLTKINSGSPDFFSSVTPFCAKNRPRSHSKGA